MFLTPTYGGYWGCAASVHPTTSMSKESGTQSGREDGLYSHVNEQPTRWRSCLPEPLQLRKGILRVNPPRGPVLSSAPFILSAYLLFYPEPSPTRSTRQCVLMELLDV